MIEPLHTLSVRLSGIIEPLHTLSGKSQWHHKPLYTLDQGRATSAPQARYDPWRSIVRPATLLVYNIAIRPAKPKPKNAGFISEITRGVNVCLRANSDSFCHGGSHAISSTSMAIMTQQKLCRFLSNNIQKSKIMIKPDLSLIYMQKPTRAGILEQPRSEEIIV